MVYLDNQSTQNGHSLSAWEQRLNEKYAWYPSELTPDLVGAATVYLLAMYIIMHLLLYVQVEQYMQCLPKDKVPLRGSRGEKHRIQQFMQQLPVYDSNLDACHKMADLDKKRMGKFVDRTKRRFFGVGSVDKMTATESLVRLTNCMQCVLTCCAYFPLLGLCWLH